MASQFRVELGRTHLDNKVRIPGARGVFSDAGAGFLKNIVVNARIGAGTRLDDYLESGRDQFHHYFGRRGDALFPGMNFCGYSYNHVN